MGQELWKRAARPLPRRRLLQVTGAGIGLTALLQACGGDDKKEASTSGAATAGAQAGGKKLSGDLKILLWTHFVPEYDTWFDKFATDWGSANNVKVRVDHIPHPQLPARHASEIAAQAGHDLIQFNGGVGGGANLYFKHLDDLDDIVEKFGRDKGGWSDYAKKISQVDGRWKTFPDYFIRFPILYREDLWAEVGMPKGPDTWEDLLEAGRKLKQKGFAGGVGYANHGDSNSSLHGILWSYGAKVNEADGKTVALNSKETREALRYGKALFDEAMPPEVLAWDDSANNTLLAGAKGGWIQNPISASLSIKRDKNLDLYNKIAIANTPKGPADRKVFTTPVTFGIWKFASNKEAARAFLAYYGDNWLEGYKASVSYDDPMLKGWSDDGFKWVAALDDPKIKELKDFSPYATAHGYPGSPNAASEEAFQSFLIPQMFAKVAKGTSIDDAIKETEAALKKIYDKYA